MKRIITILLTMVLYLETIGCAKTNNGDVLGESREMENELENLFDLLDKDEVGNRKSVYWDGNTAYMVADEYDDNNISDGKYFHGAEYLTKELWMINIEGLSDYEVVFDEETHVLYKGENWQFEVKLTNKQEEIEATIENLKNDPYLRVKSEEDKNVVFEGIREFDGRNYAGYDMTINDYFGHYYEVSYFGIGNMDDIGIMTSRFEQQFTVNFNLDSLKEKDKKVFGN